MRSGIFLFFQGHRESQIRDPRGIGDWGDSNYVGEVTADGSIHSSHHPGIRAGLATTQSQHYCLRAQRSWWESIGVALSEHPLSQGSSTMRRLEAGRLRNCPEADVLRDGFRMTPWNGCGLPIQPHLGNTCYSILLN